jgi:tRNA A-37 threonylcarbamoyl transferase component Bud32
VADLLLERVVAAVGDRYDVEAEIGRGGMAVVYRARDVRLRRRLALKVLPPDLAFRADVRTRFLREAQTAAGLNHPSIVPVYAADEADGIVYLAMALVDGESLAARLAREPCPPLPFVRRVLSEVADALAYAHAHGVVHRDVKPDNILLDKESGRAVVTDFGIARAAEADARLTATGVTVGTPAYMSPEQALGEIEVDGRSDLYALGVVAYQMLAGVLPFTASSAPGMLMKHIGERPRPLAEHRRDIPPALASAVERALGKKPEDRWNDVATFRRALLAEEPASFAMAHAPQQPAPDPPDEQRVWREHLEAQRRAWRELQRAPRRGQPLPPPPVAIRAPSPAALCAPDPLLPLDRRADRFRGKVLGSAATVTFLAFINLATVPFVPWVIFPAMGMARGLRRRWVPLRDEGLEFWDVVLARSNAVQRQSPVAAPQRPPTVQTRAVLERWADRFRTRVAVTSAAFVGAGGSLVVGMATGEDLMAVTMVASGVVSLAAGVTAMRVGSRLRRAGLRLREVLSKDWKQAITRADRRPRAAIVAEEALLLVNEAVLHGPFGAVVRTAVDDRMTLRETLAKLSPEDRSLIPDIEPTVNSLVERVAALAQSLHRLDGEVAPDMLATLDERVAAVERESPDAPDRERKLSLLQRQRATLTDIATRRAALAGQLESATLLLQNIRFDLLKLRSAGVGASVSDVSNATQEARALSRDIEHVLAAAAEVRSV